MAAGLATMRELHDGQLVDHSARLGDHLLERTRPFLERFDVVRDVRGLGLLWAMEFAEPEHGSLAWRVMERVQTGLFAQLVVVPLFTKHRIVTQVAGYDTAVLKAIPPLVLTKEDVDDFVTALEDVIRKATRPARVAGMAL